MTHKEKLIWLKTNCGMSQFDIGLELGVSQRCISDLLTGKTSMSTEYKLKISHLYVRMRDGGINELRQKANRKKT